MEGAQSVTTLPDHLPRYRLLTGLLTGSDKDAFSRRVSEALDLGYELHGPPCTAFDGERLIVAQALLWPGKATATDLVPEVTADSILVLQEQEVVDNTNPPHPGS